MTKLPANIPAKFKFLGEIGTLPLVVTAALKLYDTKETKGNGNNPAILKWAKALGIRNYDMDSIPWCGLYVAKICADAGKDPVANPLWARNWAKFGVKSERPSLGDILVFVRDGGGHVGFYIAETPKTYWVLGGNQGDCVSFTEIAKSRLLAARRPKYINRPVSAKVYHLTSTGKVSTNEA